MNNTQLWCLFEIRLDSMNLHYYPCNLKVQFGCLAIGTRGLSVAEVTFSQTIPVNSHLKIRLMDFSVGQLLYHTTSS